MGLDGEVTKVRVSLCCVLLSCVYEGLVRGGRGWVWMGRTPRLGFHSAVSSLVVFMKG